MAELHVEPHEVMEVEGLIPTGWYPVSVRLDEEEKRLVVGVLNPDDALAMARAGADVLQLERFSPAQVAALKAALAAQERKRLQAEQVAAWVEQLKAQQMPAEFNARLDMLLYEPDKNALEWKALDEAAKQALLLQLLNDARPLRVISATYSEPSV